MNNFYQSAVVTGASRGLGAAIAHALGERGLSLTLIARSSDELEHVARSIRSAHRVHVRTIAADLGNREQTRELCHEISQHSGSADVLINNAGIGSYKPLAQWSADEVTRCVDVNIIAPMLLAQAAAQKFVAQKRGYIINIASDLSRRPLANMAPYVASKHALLGFSHSLLREVKQHGVKVSAVLPGIIDSAFNGAAEGSKEESWAMRPAQLASQINALLDTPPHLIIDELTVHPLGQDF